MMGTRQEFKGGGGVEADIIYCRRWYGHKAGGITIFIKKKMARRRRRDAKALVKRELEC